MEIDEHVVVAEVGYRGIFCKFEAVKAVFPGHCPLLGGCWCHCNNIYLFVSRIFVCRYEQIVECQRMNSLKDDRL